MNILNQLKKLWQAINILIAGIVVYGLVLFVPLAFLVSVATNIKTLSTTTIIISIVIYLLIWLANFVMMVDSVAYVYGFRRPYFSGRGFGLRLNNPNTDNPFTFIITSLVSYAITLFGFSIAYICISQMDNEAFNLKASFDFISAIYFTVVTAATVGYGDIYPVSHLARLLVTLEIIVSFFYVIFIFSSIAGFTRTSSKT